MALFHIYLPSDTLSCMSDELKMQLEDALWREKQEGAMVRFRIHPSLCLFQLYTPGNPHLPLLRSNPCWFARSVPPFRAGSHLLRPTRQEDFSLSCSICTNRVRHVLRAPIVSPPRP